MDVNKDKRVGKGKGVHAVDCQKNLGSSERCLHGKVSESSRAIRCRRAGMLRWRVVDATAD